MSYTVHVYMYEIIGMYIYELFICYETVDASCYYCTCMCETVSYNVHVLYMYELQCIHVHVCMEYMYMYELQCTCVYMYICMYGMYMHVHL